MPSIYGSDSDANFEAVRDKILSAKGERAILRNVFAISGRWGAGIPDGQLRSLILAASWRWACVNIRRLAGDPDTHCVLSCGNDLAVIFRHHPAFTRLDFERIAVDALHSLPPKAFKRRRSAHGCRRR